MQTKFVSAGQSCDTVMYSEKRFIMGYDNEFDNKINKLTDFISESNSIVFFGGAGVSTESGIPDFRSKDGLYNQHDVEFDMYEPEYLLSEECLHHKPKVFFEFYRQKMDARNVKPNITHYMLARLEKLESWIRLLHRILMDFIRWLEALM